jgi:SAM-dependent methyltransferase
VDGLSGHDVRFTADDHLFHGTYLTDERADDDAAELLGLLGLAPGARLLDAGCGDGRIAVRLAAVGYSVVGVDLDPDQLDRARDAATRRGVWVEWRRGDLVELADQGAFDGAYLWFNTFGFADDASNEAVLAAVAACLRPGGSLVIDTLWREGVRWALEDEDEAVEVVVGEWVQSDLSCFDEESGRLITVRTVTTEQGASSRTLRLRLPTLAEWAELLEASGLSLKSATARAGMPLTSESMELVLLARRR